MQYQISKKKVKFLNFMQKNQQAFFCPLVDYALILVSGMKIIILISTYQRPDLLLRLLKQIVLTKSAHEIYPVIVSDGVPKGYAAVDKFLLKNFGQQIHQTEKHFGKPGYTSVINCLFGNARIKHAEINADYFIQLPDDVELSYNFFNKAVEQFAAITHPSKICMNLLNDQRRNPGWSQFNAVTELHNGYPFIHNNWIDLCFISTARFFTEINWRILPVNPEWSTDPSKSSGVGLQLTRRLTREKRFHIYMVFNSLVTHDHHSSVMHPEHRKVVPLIARAVHEKVTVGIATMPGREKSLKETLASLLPQVDNIYLTLNGFTSVPAWIRNPKIVASVEPTNSLGDAAKFGYKAQKGYIFTCDDDLIYAPDYVKNMVCAIEKYNRKCVITIHGRRFMSMPVKSYYHCDAFVVRCLGSLAKDLFMHIPGTGVSAWHSSAVKIKLSDFEVKNMSDIWMGVICQKQRVPVVAIEHVHGWVLESRSYDNTKTICYTQHRTDDVQTHVVNSTNWKLYMI